MTLCIKKQIDRLFPEHFLSAINGRQRRNIKCGQLIIVKTGYYDIFWDFITILLQALHSADRHRIICKYNCLRRLVFHKIFDGFSSAFTIIISAVNLTITNRNAMLFHSIPICPITFHSFFTLQNTAHIIDFCQMMFLYQMFYNTFLAIVIRYSDIMHSINIFINTYRWNPALFYPVHQRVGSRFILY